MEMRWIREGKKKNGEEFYNVVGVVKKQELGDYLFLVLEH